MVKSGHGDRTDKIDDAVLALLWLKLHAERRAWKGFDWDALDRLHRKGMSADPVNKAKSVVLTDAGLRRSEERFCALFTQPIPSHVGYGRSRSSTGGSCGTGR